MKIYSKYNFHKYTFCIFNEVLASEIDLLKSNYTSRSGSSYYFTEKGVYRKSNHWGRAANCKWRLQSISAGTKSRTKIGYAHWTDFHSINENDKLYFIEVNFDEKSVQYIHKNSSDKADLFLRTANDTTKRIKEIRQLFENDKKLSFWNFDNSMENLLNIVVYLMISTNLSLLQIKQKVEKNEVL